MDSNAPYQKISVRNLCLILEVQLSPAEHMVLVGTAMFWIFNHMDEHPLSVPCLLPQPPNSTVAT